MMSQISLSTLSITQLVILLAFELLAGWIGWQAHAFIFPQPLSTSRVCELTGKVYSERELIDNLLFKDKASLLSNLEKKVAMSARGSDYPNCCYIGDLKTNWIVDVDKPQAEQDPPHYTVQFYSLESTGSNRFVRHLIYIDSCGRTINHFGGSYNSGEAITENQYIKRKSEIKKYWEEMGALNDRSAN